MTNEEVLGIFRESKALLKGHFLLSSGKHSDSYFQKSMVLQYPWHAEKLCRALAEKTRPLGAQTVAAPAIGALVIGHEVARALGVRSIFTERNSETDAMELRRGFTLEKGEKVLAVEDIVTTGKSIKECISVLRALGADLVGVGCLVDRTGGEAQKLFDVPLTSLASLRVESWEEKDCPLCKQGLPVVKPGSRAKF